MFGGLLKSTSLAALVAVAGIAAAGSANAADLGGNCCADLEERIAELEATTARKGNRKVSLTVSGFVNEAVMVWDDGVETNAYQVTNGTTRTRFRFVGNAKINADWSAGYLLEIGLNGVTTGDVSQTADDGTGSVIAIRHSAWWLQSKQLGRLWVGQTSSAADGITEISLANTGHFVAVDTTLSGGNFRLRRSNGALTGTTFNALTNSLGGGVGEGSRFNVVKYETPSIAGFIASAAWGEDDMWDVALRYGGEFNGIKIAGGIAYAQWTDAERGYVNIGGQSGVSGNELGGSLSVMHVPTGLFVTGIYGYREDDNRIAFVGGAGNTSRDETFAVVAGIEQKFFPIGKTTLYGEYFEGTYGANALALGTANAVGGSVLASGARIVNSDVSYFGLGFNQAIDAAAMDIYVSYRNHQFDATGVDSTKSNLEDLQIVTMGARIQF